MWQKILNGYTWLLAVINGIAQMIPLLQMYAKNKPYFVRSDVIRHKSDTDYTIFGKVHDPDYVHNKWKSITCSI